MMQMKLARFRKKSRRHWWNRPTTNTPAGVVWRAGKAGDWTMFSIASDGGELHAQLAEDVWPGELVMFVPESWKP